MSIASELDKIVDGEIDNEHETETEKRSWTLDDLDPNEPICFDIETGPEPDEVLAELFEFDEESTKGYVDPNAKFDGSGIKYGNMGAEKRAEKLAKAKLDFLGAKAMSQSLVDSARDEAWHKFVDKAALSPITGRVLAIGYGQKDGGIFVDKVSDGRNDGGDIIPWNSERDLLSRLWDVYKFAKTNRCRLYGFNSYAFDVPFILRRSWKLRVPGVPRDILVRGRIATPFHDIMRDYQCGQYRDYISLNAVAKFFGVGEKNGDGAMFSNMFFGTPEEHEQAIEYAANDIKMTIAVADRMWH